MWATSASSSWGAGSACRRSSPPRRGATVTATDWSQDAIALLRENAARNGLELRADVRDWREPWGERFDLAIVADVLYERRNVQPVLARLRELAPESLVALAGRPYEDAFLRAVGRYEEVAPRVVRIQSR
jgi:predicted nicotinamide N-methyase